MIASIERSKKLAVASCRPPCSHRPSSACVELKAMKALDLGYRMKCSPLPTRGSRVKGQRPQGQDADRRNAGSWRAKRTFIAGVDKVRFAPIVLKNSFAPPALHVCRSDLIVIKAPR